MNKYVEQLLQYYKEGKITHDIALSLLESYKGLGEKNASNDAIAIIGISCRMPMAQSKEEFWERLQSGTNCVSHFPLQRRKDTDPLIPALANNLHSLENPYWVGGFLPSVDCFDNDFFHITAAEAKIMDPQQRIFLEIAHSAFEDAGYSTSTLNGSNTGVFIGDVVNEYRKIVTEVSPLAVIGNISPFIASRVSYFYNLHGPTINVSTTCSTSLVAVHLACKSLLTKESDLVLAGAVNLRLFPFAFKDDPVDALGITSPDGACYTFDNRANGIVRGEGVVAIVLKRYEDAIRDKNHIYALIRGSHVNNDGQSSNVGAPNPIAHAALLKKAWENSRVDPRQISYIEAHGTGTHIGDPIEVQGIGKAFSFFTQHKQFCGIGSVKTNIGHLTGGASGLAGLIKTALALHYQQIPPSLHFDHPNELIDFPNTPLFVVDRLTPWPKEQKSRVAGVSAFGFNGTNCHVVLEEAPSLTRETKNLSSSLPFLFTHRTPSGLKNQMRRFADFFGTKKNHLKIEDVSFTLYYGRDHFSTRLLLFANSIDELLQQITNFLIEPKFSTSTIDQVDWDKVFQGLNPCFVPLPTYFFESKRFWLDSEVWNNDEQITKVAIAPSQNKIDRNSLVQQLVNLFQTVLGVDQIKPTDNFFDLGGDSLIGFEIISLIHKKLGKKISYNDLFQNPKILDLAQLLGTKENSLFQDIPAAPLKESYPLSYGQRRLWILHQMQDHPIAYNIYDTYEFEGKLDLEMFQSALNQLVERHVAFRTVIKESDGQPYQKVTSAKRFDLTIIKETSLERVHEKIDSFRHQPFDLEEGPLAKALLFILSPTSSIFFFMVHHLISDGWSIRIIIQELLKLYQGVLLEPLKISTIDFCHWQQVQSPSENRFEQMEAFWLNRLKGPLPISEIPGDKIRPPVFTFQGHRKSFHISKDEEQKLSALSGKENATLFMALLASVYVLIYRYTGQTDLIIGSPIAGRSHADLKPLVGFFVNTLALRSTLNPVESFQLFLRSVRDQTLQDFEHQEYPFDLLIDKLKLERDTSRSPLFNINVAFQNFELDEDAKKSFTQLKAQRVDLPHDSCKWDLEFEFIKQHDGSITCLLEYYTCLYSEEMISTLIFTYQTLMRSIIEGFEKPINEIQLSPSSYSISGPKKHYSNLPLHELFEQQAARLLEKPAIKNSDQVFSYKELNEKANQLAYFLKFEKQLKPEECVGLYLDNSPEAIISILGILKSGGAYVPLDTKSPIDRIKFIINEAKIRCIISKKKYLRTLNDLQWTSSLEAFLCLDAVSIHDEIEETHANFMDVEMWNQVAREGQDEIASSGWVSSYTGLSFSKEEMEEYKHNVHKKLQPYLSPNCRVLEIGCGSGLTAFKIAPEVGFYLGVDLSVEIIQKNQARAKQENFSNLQFACCEAHEIDQLDPLDKTPFDLIIINSVIHCFPGLSYFKNVLKKAISFLNKKSLIFLGDLMDLDLKEQLEHSLRNFKAAHRTEGFRTKTQWDQELFISKEFLGELRADFPSISEIKCSKKEGRIENELTLFRFDALIFIDQTSTSRVPKKRRQHGSSCLKSHPIENLKLPLSDRNLAYVLFTSGSTGLPKGVMVEHRSIHNYISWAISFYTTDLLKFPLYSSLHFDLTVTSIFAPLLSGGYLRIFSGEIDEILENLKQSDDCNVLKLTPAHLSMISNERLVPPSIQQFIVGGDTLYASQALHLSSLYSDPIKIFNEYGPTEATVGCIVHQWDPAEKEGPLLIGDPIANCKIHILDEYLQPVPIGGIGEIVIEGDCLARGYFNRPDMNEKKFRKDPKSGARIYFTGDLGRYLPNKKIAYLGRKDRQIKIKGYRIELDEIESSLLRYPSITSCTVTVKNNPDQSRTLCGYYVAMHPIAPEELSQFLSQTLPSYMVPSFLIQLDALPITRNGKIDTAQLPDMAKERAKAVIPPSSALELSLHKIWSRVLNIPEANLSIEDDFFDLGGDSIMAMRILPLVKKLGLHLSIKEIFKYRTIKSISQKTTLSVFPEIPQKEVKGSFSFSPIQRWFLNHKMTHSSYFNMAYLFRVPIKLQIERLEEAFRKCFDHHDALRTVFKGSQQEILPSADLQFQIDEFDLEDLKGEQQKNEILRLTTLLQENFNLENAPLVKAAVFNLGEGEKRLFLTLHHLIIDGVSWRYLIEDLSNLYTSSLMESLPSKTSSYKAWVEALENLPTLGRKEIGEWLDINPLTFPKLSDQSPPLIGDTVETFIHISEQETKTLFSNTHTYYGANPNEFLLSALMLSVSESFGIDKLLIHHEGHGRHPVDQLDVSRTIGWFTTIYPLLLEKQKDPTATLLNVQENLRRFGQKDLLYCVAKYMQKNPQLDGFKPEILFNFFGRIDGDLLQKGESQIFGNSEEVIAQTSHSNNTLTHLIEINSIIIQDRLRISIVYAPKSFKTDFIEPWIECFEKKILEYIPIKQKNACFSKKEGI